MKKTKEKIPEKGLKIIRVAALMEKLGGVGFSTIKLWVKDGVLPKPIKIGPRAVGWVESQIDAWILERLEESKDCPDELDYEEKNKKEMTTQDAAKYIDRTPLVGTSPNFDSFVKFMQECVEKAEAEDELTSGDIKELENE